MNPYENIADHQFWKRAISNTSKHLVNPHVSPKFQLTPSNKVATAGSCFAQHIGSFLKESGFSYLVSSDGANSGPDHPAAFGYGTFSARYGNIYTPRQLLQLIEESLGKRSPKEIAWKRNDQKWVDARRPSMQPEGLENRAAVEDERKNHLKHVLSLFQKMDTFVFTLGLTEAWISQVDGTTYPSAPGTLVGSYDPSVHAFRNFTPNELIDDLTRALHLLRKIQPSLNVILTVSPVPLIATYEDRHVLTANTYSKSALRVAAGLVADSEDWIDYFPSYEIITGNHTRGTYLEDDLRRVTPIGVAHVMRCFSQSYLNSQTEDSDEIDFASSNLAPEDLICDEEAYDQ